jgi:signal transduction histidine kinase
MPLDLQVAPVNSVSVSQDGAKPAIQPLRDADVLARMASNLVHDLKNLVNPLSLYLRILERQIDRENAAAHASLAEMNGVIAQSMVVLERLRDFSLQAQTELVEPTPVDEALNDVIESARRRVGGPESRVTVRGELAAGPVLARADRRQLVVALEALVSNALDAVAAAGGTVVVCSDAVDGCARVRVVDDGDGMTSEVCERAFEPLFSTKGALGAGLGLSNVFAFARRCGGSVALLSRVGEGTTVTLELPIVTLPSSGR